LGWGGEGFNIYSYYWEEMNRPLKAAGEVEQGLQLKAKREGGRAIHQVGEKKEEHQLVAEGMRGRATV
jgi:hypothetical protein